MMITNNVKGIVHVVAKQYQLNDTDIIPPSGIAELIGSSFAWEHPLL